MTRLASAEAVIGAAMASKGDFDRQLDRLRHDAEIVAAIGEAVRQPDYEYHDDDTYRGYAATMRDAAVKIRDASAKKDYDAARAAASELKKSCDTCHGDYRS
jgi:cytochrome c556